MYGWNNRWTIQVDGGLIVGRFFEKVEFTIHDGSPFECNFCLSIVIDIFMSLILGYFVSTVVFRIISFTIRSRGTEMVKVTSKIIFYPCVERN